MSKKMKKQIIDKGIELVMGYINSLGADLTTRFLFGGNKEVNETLHQIETHVAAGHPELALAAASTLKSRMSAAGQTDEEMIFQDLMEVRRLGLTPARKVRESVMYLATLTPDQRRRIRKGNMAEGNNEVRQNKWAEFANARDDAERAAILQGSGFFDPTEFERIQAWDQTTFGQRAADAEIAAQDSLNRLNARGARQHRGFLGWINPLHR